MARIVALEDYQNIKNLEAAIGDGRNLALNPDQTSKLHDNAKNKVTTFQTEMVKEKQPSEPVAVNEAVIPTENIINMQEQPNEIPNVVESAPIENNIHENPIPSIEAPVVNEVPNISVVEQPKEITIPTIMEPTIPVVEETPSVNQVEIVREEKENELFSNITTRISQINEEYDKKIEEINKERKQKILEVLEENKKGFIEEQAKILDLKEKAEEHLKNAQAAEQIATIAHQNAQNIQNMEVQV